MYLYINSIVTAINVGYSLFTERYKALRPEAVSLARNCLRSGGATNYEQKFRGLLHRHDDVGRDIVTLLSRSENFSMEDVLQLRR